MHHNSAQNSLFKKHCVDHDSFYADASIIFFRSLLDIFLNHQLCLFVILRGRNNHKNGFSKKN